jgi:hypothetical protein
MAVSSSSQSRPRRRSAPSARVSSARGCRSGAAAGADRHSGAPVPWRPGGAAPEPPGHRRQREQAPEPGGLGEMEAGLRSWRSQRASTVCLTPIGMAVIPMKRRRPSGNSPSAEQREQRQARAASGTAAPAGRRCGSRSRSFPTRRCAADLLQRAGVGGAEIGAAGGLGDALQGVLVHGQVVPVLDLALVQDRDALAGCCRRR